MSVSMFDSDEALEAAEREVAAWLEESVPRWMAAIPERNCVECGTSIKLRRRLAKTCGARCRKRLSRRRRRAAKGVRIRA